MTRPQPLPVVLACLVLIACVVPALAAPAKGRTADGPRSLTIAVTFEGADTSDALPVPWARGGNAAGGVASLDSVAHAGSRSVRVHMRDSSGLLAAVCTIPDSLRLGRVAAHLTGWVRTDAAGGAGLMMRVQGQHGALAFVDRSEPGLRGTAGWTRQEILVPLPPATRRLTFGVVVRGGGSAWADDFTLRLYAPGEAPPPAPAVRAWVAGALDSLRSHALGAATTNWAALRTRVLAMLPGARTSAEAWSVLDDALSAFEPPTRLVTPGAQVREDSLALAAARGNGTWPRADRFDGWCGYLGLPGLPGGNAAAGDRYASQVQDDIAALDSVGVCGYIVDLRRADGTRAEAMLAGLGPLLGEGPYGSEVGPDSVRVAWTYADGVFTRSRGRRTLSAARAQRVAHTHHDRPPVAVLIGPGTLGAGEAVATALRGRPDTRFFGSPTAGAANGVTRVRLRDGAVLVIASRRCVDRSGNVTRGPVQPDERDQGAPQQPGYREPLIEAALQWIRERPGCLQH